MLQKWQAKKWLEGRNFTEESAELDKINSEDDIEIIRQLAKIFKIDINSIDEHIKILEEEAVKAMELALIEASGKGNLEVVKTLVENGVNLETKDCLDYTALIRASREGHLEIVKILVENGANLEVKDCWGNTGLYPNIDRFKVKNHTS